MLYLKQGTYRLAVRQLCNILLLLLLISCGGQKEVAITRAGIPTAASADSFNPPFAKAKERVTVSGRNFLTSKTYKAVFKLSESESKESPLTVVSETTATFLMPEVSA